MIKIQPISDLRNHFSKVSKTLHQQDEPIFFTKNGIGDMAVMSIQAYEKLQARLELLQKLSEAEVQSREQQSSGSEKDVILRLRKKIQR